MRRIALFALALAVLPTLAVAGDCPNGRCPRIAPAAPAPMVVPAVIVQPIWDGPPAPTPAPAPAPAPPSPKPHRGFHPLKSIGRLLFAR